MIVSALVAMAATKCSRSIPPTNPPNPRPRRNRLHAAYQCGRGRRSVPQPLAACADCRNRRGLGRQHQSHASNLDRNTATAAQYKRQSTARLRLSFFLCQAGQTVKASPLPIWSVASAVAASPAVVFVINGFCRMRFHEVGIVLTSAGRALSSR
jgi:hypothetical protein